MTNLPHNDLPSTRTASKLLEIMVVPLQEIIDNIYKMLSRIVGASSIKGAAMIQAKRTTKLPWE